MENWVLVLIVIFAVILIACVCGPPLLTVAGQDRFWTLYVTDEAPVRRFHAANVRPRPWARDIPHHSGPKGGCGLYTAGFHDLPLDGQVAW